MGTLTAQHPGTCHTEKTQWKKEYPHVLSRICGPILLAHWTLDRAVRV